MSRKTLTYTAGSDFGRDAGKVYILTEMPAAKAEKWAIKIFLAIGNTGVPIPESILSMGVSGLLVIGLSAFQHIRFEAAEPIIDEMMDCVTVMPDPSKPMITRPLIEDDIEEITTRLKIRKEVLNLNLSFFENAVPST